MTPWLALVNPYAAHGRHAKTRVNAALGARNIPAEVIEVDGLPALRDVVDRAAGQNSNRFVAVGGDGTVNAVLNAILEHRWETVPVMAVLPAGSGCDLLRTFGIDNNIEQAADHLAGETTYPVDVGVAIGAWGRRYFLNVASTGATAAAAKTARSLPGWWGSFRYVGGLLGALPGSPRCEIVVEAGRRRFHGESLTVVLANGQYFGGGFNVAPRASMVDQLLDIQVFTARKREIGHLAAKVRGGHHLSDPAVRRYVAAEARVETTQPWMVEVDGEPIGTTPVLIRLQPGRILLKV